MRIQPTRHTPLVIIDEAAGSITISGVSIPENAYIFFRHIEEYIEGLDPEKVKSIAFIFRLEYMNTLSSKAFLDYMRMVKDTKKIALNVTWEYFSDDEECMITDRHSPRSWIFHFNSVRSIRKSASFPEGNN